MKSSKIEGHFRIYIAFFGAKKKVIEFSIPGAWKDVMSPDGSKEYRIFDELESETIIFCYWSFPTMFGPLDAFHSERGMGGIV